MIFLIYEYIFKIYRYISIHNYKLDVYIDITFSEYLFKFFYNIGNLNVNISFENRIQAYRIREEL